MESPFTGGKVMLLKEKKQIEFRKDLFEITQLFYRCVDTGEEFSTDEVDQINLNQLYNQYRVKYGIPFPEEIKEIREQYGLSASKMSEILGLGTNSYRQYESGDIPTVANGRLILASKDPGEFIKFLDASESLLTPKEYLKFKNTALEIIEEKKANFWNLLFFDNIFTYSKPSEYNGYKKPDQYKVANMISYFSQSLDDLYKTKLNKLLFYSDFLCYKMSGYSISGIAYKAIQMGPVPAEYDKLYIKLTDENMVDLKFVPFRNGNYGEALKGKVFDQSIFEEKELQAMNAVLNKFGKKSTNEMVEISHLESGWIENEESRDMISYSKYAFELSQI
ncbi:type II toxin-antitoxin system antitoxin SocA domain-containing protein [Pedobacter sp. P351]|uniref:type II toxin-antitoxin system antitoxin SocA domain-containing protein n=1 Tax=Pedobacter superstes TaxID=3133441 RepID=UPI0030B24A9B